MSVLKAVATRLAWVFIALLIALGGAGVVAMMTKVPGTDARQELTWAGDAEVRPGLDAATVHLEALSAKVGDLAGTARLALTQLSGAGAGAGALQATIDEGTAQLLVVRTLGGRLAAALADVPYTGDDWGLHVSAPMHERWRQLDGTAGLADGLEAEWAGFTGLALDAGRLSSLLVRHDEETAAAAKLGTSGKYKAAIEQLAASAATIVAARELRDELAKSTEVATLTDWIDRNAAYDSSLETLYAALVKSDGRASAEVKKAFKREQAARAQLPGDTRGMVVIMSDIAQGGLNQAVISIEEARGALAQALEVEQQLRDGGDIAPPE